MTQAVHFFDSSALVKRYAQEAGSDWVDEIIDPGSGIVAAIAQITVAEVAAALAGKRRGRFISDDEFETAVEDLLLDSSEKYTVVTINQVIIDLAVKAVRRHPLRGYDAVQLACALALNDTLRSAGEPPIIFVGTDNALLSAATSEGLTIKTPNQ